MILIRFALTMLLINLMISPMISAQYSAGSLMSLLSGSVMREAKQANQINDKESENGLLDTLNLSYAGNMDFSRALDQVIKTRHDLEVLILNINLP